MALITARVASWPEVYSLNIKPNYSRSILIIRYSVIKSARYIVINLSYNTKVICFIFFHVFYIFKQVFNICKQHLGFECP